MKILHYNDEERRLHHYLSERGHQNVVISAQTDPNMAIDREQFDAAFIGLHPHGLQLIRKLHRRNPDCLVNMITADRNTRIAVEAIKLGAFDYLLTPLNYTEVERTVIMMTREHEGQRERLGLEGRLDLEHQDISKAKADTALPSGTLRQIVWQVERSAIRRALRHARGNISEAARHLDISRTTLYAKLQ